MTERKGAIQMSLGFIVAIVFAVVFLSLAVVWVSNFMQQVNPLTDTLIQEARQEVKDTLTQTNQKFSVYPKNWNLDRGDSLPMVAGVINKETDSAEHNFVVNVYHTQPDITSTWIDDTDFSLPLKAGYGDIVDFPITITPNVDAPAGTYVFYVIACIDTPFVQCTTPDDQNYESTQYVRINLR